MNNCDIKCTEPQGGAAPLCEAGTFENEFCYIVKNEVPACKRHGVRRIVNSLDLNGQCVPGDPQLFEDDGATPIDPGTIKNVQCAEQVDLTCDTISKLATAITVGDVDLDVQISQASIDQLADAISTESDMIDWCIDGQDLTQHVIKVRGVPNGITHWTNAAGALIADPLPTATNAAKGACAINQTYIDIPMCSNP